MDQIEAALRKKLSKKYSKELKEAMAERELLDIKVKALAKIVRTIEGIEEPKESKE